MRKEPTFVKRTLRSVLAGALATSLLASSALAQVPSVSAPPYQPSTFMVGGNVTPGALTTSDIICITGSASKLIKVKSIKINGVDATAQTVLWAIIKRSAASTGGTATQPTPVPIDSGQAITTPTAVVNVYTAAPTPGTAVGTMSQHYQALAALTVGAVTDDTEWVWHPADLYSDVRLRGTAQQLCLNSPGSFTTAAPTIAFELVWTEQ